AHGSGVEDMRRLMTEVIGRLDRLGMQHPEVRPRHSLSIRSQDERDAGLALLERFRPLPDDLKRQVPALLNGLGKLQVGAGDFGGARANFLAVSRLVSDDVAKGEAQGNAYRAALEARKYDEALTHVRNAAGHDAGRFAPFRLDRYEPMRILGAG